MLFVDPDGLDHDERQTPARPLEGGGWHASDSDDVRVVLCSAHRTRVELEQLQHDIGIGGPFITENGGALFVPRAYFDRSIDGARRAPGFDVVERGAPYAQVVDHLHRAAQRLRIDVIGFNDLTIAEVAERCGMSLLQARLATLREYVEVYWVATSDPAAPTRLKRALRAAGLVCAAAEGRDLVGASAHLPSTASLLLTLFRRALTDPEAYTCGWSAADAIGRSRLSRLPPRAWPPDVRRLHDAVKDRRAS